MACKMILVCSLVRYACSFKPPFSPSKMNEKVIKEMSEEKMQKNKKCAGKRRSKINKEKIYTFI